jgi:hypothetical protein
MLHWQGGPCKPGSGPQTMHTFIKKAKSIAGRFIVPRVKTSGGARTTACGMETASVAFALPHRQAVVRFCNKCLQLIESNRVDVTMHNNSGAIACVCGSEESHLQFDGDVALQGSYHTLRKDVFGIS